jgi:hypothetical protein
MHSRLFGANLRETDHLEYLGVNGGVILKSIFSKYDKTLCSGVHGTRIVIIGGLLLTL